MYNAITPHGTLINPYQRDIKVFMSPAIAQLAANPVGPNFMIGATLLGFGLERVTKAILWNLNPIYVLKEPSFKHSACVLYKDRFFSTPDKDAVAHKPEGDTITLKESILRAGVFSESVNIFKATFYTACELRDIGAHCDLELPQIDRLRTSLLRHLGPLLNNLLSCKILEESDYSQREIEKIREISDNLETDQRIESLLSKHLEKWNKLSQDEKEKQKKLKYSKPSDGWNDFIECPACHEQAILKWEVEFDVADGQGYPSGCYLDQLECKHCGLVIEDLEDISWLGFPIDRFDHEEDY